ncbi:MAG: sigma-70 family RNA polymerase sigma factor [Oscillospiraceae bacterium]|nr:sigma-70 family RNA polymerase sigma factor [Oscillospiraceae bacterium]
MNCDANGLNENQQENKPATETAHTKCRNYCVRVYNTCTKQYEMVQVTKEVYDVYRRTGWNIEDNDDSFYEHEIQFTSMCPSDSVNTDSFHEFVKFNTDPAIIFEKKERRILAQKALNELAPKMRTRYLLHYHDRLTYKEIAEIEDVSEETIKEALASARKIIKNFLEKNEK